MKVVIYNEFIHEQSEEHIRKIYPGGIHGAIKDSIESDEISVRCITLDTVGEITEELLDSTDVLIWWGHMAHNQVPDEVANAVVRAIQKGMGAIFLHS